MMLPSPKSAIALLCCALLIGCAYSPTPDQPAPEQQPADEQTTEAPDAAEATDIADEGEDSRESDEAAAKTRALALSISEQQFSYLEDGEVVRTGPISSGAPGYPTPTGNFSVLYKDRDKVSSRYTNQLGMQAWMPYAIQFNGHYFLHEGWLPGHPDSHGCVRLGEKDARFLYETLQIGDEVVVES